MSLTPKSDGFLIGLITGILFAVLVLFMTSCGYQEWDESDCFNGCGEDSNERDGEAAGNSRHAVGIPGPAGPIGPAGNTGAEGVPGGVGADGPRGVTGETGVAGAEGARGPTGIDGAAGAVGPAGPNGVNGTNGVNGIDGATGSPGPSGAAGSNAPPTDYTIVELIDPCGDGPGYDEVLLQLANGQLMAHYAGGGNLQFLTVIGPGNYSTTDSQACSFTVDSEMEVSW